MTRYLIIGAVVVAAAVVAVARYLHIPDDPPRGFSPYTRAERGLPPRTTVDTIRAVRWQR